MNCCVTRLLGCVSSNGINVIIALPHGTVLVPRTRYDIELNAPIPVSGYNLPVVIDVAEYSPMPLIKLGLGNADFGEDVCRRDKLHTYHTDANSFVDLRRRESCR